jgi:outer membrane protein assembly factor BamB
MNRLPIALLAAAWALAPAAADAQPLAPGNLLASDLFGNRLFEYTPAGTVVRTVPFPNEHLRDIAVGPGGVVQAYNGSQNPQLSTFVPATGAITGQTLAGWSCFNNISYGGIGVIGDGVFVTDMLTFNGGEPQGIIRFSTTGGAPLRFATAQEYQDLTVGGDGLIYALRGGLRASQIDVFDPTTFAPVRTVTLSSDVTAADVRGLAVSAAGAIYAAAWNGQVYALSPAGLALNSRATGTSGLADIDLDDAGRLLVGSRIGEVILTDVTLASQTSFVVAGGPTVHVAFATPLTVVPEPSSFTLAGVGLAGWLAARRRRGH